MNRRAFLSSLPLLLVVRPAETQAASGVKPPKPPRLRDTYQVSGVDALPTGGHRAVLANIEPGERIVGNIDALTVDPNLFTFGDHWRVSFKRVDQ